MPSHLRQSSLQRMPEDEALDLSSSVASLTSQASSISTEFTNGPMVQSPPAVPVGGFDIVKYYAELLSKDEHLAMPVAAIEALSQIVVRSEANTMTELISELQDGASLLQRSSFNPVSLSAGADLLLRFVTLQRPAVHQPFSQHKKNLALRAKEFVSESGRCAEKVVENAGGFVRDDTVIMTHSYSRVVTHTLLRAAKQRKRFRVYVTESRPFGLGIKTHAILTKAGIPCQVILDSAVAFVMSKIDMVMLGAEALAENGGLVNFVGSYQMAMIAKAADKPVYALAESFKFLRIFPLNQYDLPLSVPVLNFSSAETSPEDAASSKRPIPATPSRPLLSSETPKPLEMTAEQIQTNPLIDYTTPDLITLVISDIGILTPSGVSDTLLRIFSG